VHFEGVDRDPRLIPQLERQAAEAGCQEGGDRYHGYADQKQ
jgi:hypothetical protein